MTDQTRLSRHVATALLPAATSALAAGVFIAQALVLTKLAVGVLYMIVVFLAARFCSPRGIALVGAGCIGLTILAYLLSGFGGIEAAGIRLPISIGVVGFATFMVSERKRAEQMLRGSEEQWREVFEHNPIMYFIVDAGGIVLSVNGFGATQLDYMVDELVGQPLLSLFLEEDQQVVRDQLAACVGDLGHSRSWENRKLRKDGSVLWVRENAKAIRRSGTDAVVLIACEEVSERRRGEQRMATQYAVTRVLAEADSLAAASPQLLRAIGENFEWEWGALWSFDRQSEREAIPLRCDCLWHGPDIKTTEFDAISQKGSLRAWEGRLGEVWRNASPSWIVDATTEPGFLRAPAASRDGLRGGVIFPILLDAEPLGVIEFFSRAARERDAEHLVTLAAIGSQIGQFIQRRRAEAALRASEERWRKLFETSSAGMGLFRLDGLCTAANPTLQRMLGLREDEIVGHNVLELNHPDERSATAEALARYRAGTLTERNVEKRYLKKDGTTVWLNITNTMVPATEIALPFVQAVYIDVTGRVKAEAALRASEERWRTVFETAAVGIVTLDLDLRYLTANMAFEQMTGYTENELRHMTPHKIAHEDDRVTTQEVMDDVAAIPQHSRRRETRFRRKDGDIVWADVNSSLIRGADGTPAFLASMAVDITERKRAEAALRASEERWRAIFDSAAVGIAAGDLRGSLFNVNPTFQSMLGYTEEELRNLRAFEFTHEDDRAETRRLLTRVVTGQQPSYRLEKRYRRKDGAIVWADVSASIVPATDTAPAFLAVMAVEITDRKRAEEALREAEERFRTLVQFSFDVYWESDAQHRFIRQQFAEGLADAPAPGFEIGKRRWEVPYLEPDAEAWRKHRETLDAHLPFRDFEHARPTPDGGRRYVSVSGLPVFDKAGVFIGYRGVGRHITDRKRAEAALRASEERWRAMFETAPVGITMLDFKRRTYLAANGAFERMTGYTEDELRRLTALDVTHEEDRASAQRRIDDGVIGGQQKRYRRKDGELIWADVSAFVVPATDSTPAFLGAVILDITGRKRAEAALRASEERWRTVFEAAAVGIATTDLEHRYLTANETYQRMTGYTERELQNLTPEEITHGDDLAATRKFLDGIFTGLHRSYRIEKRYRRKDGEIVWADVNPFFVPATESTPALCAAIVVDITERKRAEEALQQAEADLARLNRVMLLGEMTASIAHEINQPIAAVITNASAGLRWLGARQPDLDEVRQALGRIVRDGSRAGEVIGRIRALVRKLPPRRDRLCLGEAIHEVIALTQSEMQRHGVGLQSQLQDGLPLITADRVQLQQVMINLIVNAIEAMSTSERPRELTIISGTDHDTTEVFVEVQDTGAGLDPEKLDLLFQSFYTTKPDGIGMGLAISRSIVDAHGGALSAAPNRPHGAVFRFTLPVDEIPSPHAICGG
ncbi:MAG TPA: PAS domain S-box protein [Stellaceae bacterium]